MIPPPARSSAGPFSGRSTTPAGGPRAGTGGSTEDTAPSPSPTRTKSAGMATRGWLRVERLVHLADHLGAGVDEGLVAFVLPLRGADLVGLLAHVDVGLELPHHLVDVPAEVVEVHLHVQKLPFGVDDERAPEVEARALVVDAEQTRHLARGIGPHLVLDVGQLLLAPLPSQVREMSVRAHGNDVTAHPLEPLVLLCQSSKLGRSDEREVGGIEEEDRPALPGDLVPEAELSEITLDGVIGGELEVGNDLSQPEPGAGIGHTDRPPVWFHLVDCLIAPDAARDFFHRT